MKDKKKIGFFKKYRKYIFHIIVLLVVSLGTMYYFVNDEFFSVVESLQNADWIVITFLLISITILFFFDSLILYTLTKRYNNHYSFLNATNTAVIGILGDGITPFASGGQLIQFYVHRKQGIKTAKSSSILLGHFIMHQIMLVTVSTIAIVVRFSSFGFYGDLVLFDVHFNFLLLTIIGYVINTAFIFGLFMAAYSRRVHSFISRTGLSIARKLRLVKDVEKTKAKMEKSLLEFRYEMKYYLKNISIFIRVGIYHLIRFIILFSSPFLAIVAIDKGILSDPNVFNYYIDTFAMAVFLNLIVGYFPVPGGSGGSEAIYVVMFEKMLAPIVWHTSTLSAIIPTSMLIWRFASFYYGMILGLIFFLVFYQHHSRHKTISIENEQEVEQDEDKLEEVEVVDSTQNEQI